MPAFTDIDTLTLETGENFIRRLTVQGTHAYCLTQQSPSKLVVVDVSDPTNLTRVTAINMSDAAFGLTSNGNYVYVGLDTAPGSIKVVDVSTPSSPTVVGTATFNSGENSAFELQMKGSTVVVAITDGSNAELVTTDVTTAASPARLGGLSITGMDTGAVDSCHKVQGNFSYLADASNNIFIVDITDPTSPTLRGTTELTGLNAGSAIAVSGNYLYWVADSINTQKFVVVDITDKDAPVEVGRCDYSAFDISPYKLLVDGNRVYAFPSGGALDIVEFDVGTPSAPFAVRGFSSTNSSTRDAALLSNRYFLMAETGSPADVYTVERHRLSIPK